MSTSDDSLCRQKSVFVVSSQLSFLLSPRTRQDRCLLPTGAPGAGTNALTTSCRPVRGWLTLHTEGLRSEEESQDGQPRASPPSLTKAAHISAQGGGSDHLQTRGVTRGSPEVSPWMGREVTSSPGTLIRRGSPRAAGANGSCGAWPGTGTGTGAWGAVLFLNHPTLCQSTSLAVKQGTTLCPSCEQDNCKRTNNKTFWQQIEGTRRCRLLKKLLRQTTDLSHKHYIC